MAISQYDLGLYVAKESGRGTPATGAFTGVLQYSSVQVETNVRQAGREAAVGLGMWLGPSVSTGNNLAYTVNGQVTLAGQWAEWFFAGWTTRNTTGAGPAYTHTYTPIRFNSSLPWWTYIGVFGQGDTAGVGISSSSIQDAKLTGWKLMYKTDDVMRFTHQGVALNEAKPAGTETYTAETVAVKPIPASSTHVFSWPSSWSTFSAGLCLNEIEIDGNFSNQITAPCANSDGQMSDVLIITTGLDVVFRFQYNAASEALYEYINGKILSAAAGANILKSGFNVDPMSISWKSLETITTGTPYEFGFTNLNLQWLYVNRQTSGTPQMVEVHAQTYDVNPTWSFYVKNGKTGTAMAL